MHFESRASADAERQTRALQPDQLTKTMRELLETNVIAYIHLFSLFVPLVQRGQGKKMVAITSGMADTDLVNRFEIASGALYSTSKAALNMVVAKFNAQYKKNGILFLALCPGMVDVGHFANSMTCSDRLLAILHTCANTSDALQ